MSATIQITVTDTASAVLARISDARLVLSVLSRVMDQENQFTVSHIWERYLSFPKDQPATMDGLRVVSNRLRGSLRASKTRLTESGLESSIGSNVHYAAIHEFGGVTAPHVIRPRRGKALSFFIGGRQVCVHSVNHPGSQIPARAPIRRGLADRAGAYTQAFSDAILNLTKGGAS